MEDKKQYTNLEKYNWWNNRAKELNDKMKFCVSAEKVRECLVKAQLAEAKAAYYLVLCRQGKADKVG